jgi:hypothetical protein
MQIAFRQQQVLSEGTRMFHDAEYAAIGTVPAESASAKITSATSQVDFTRNALANKGRRISFDNFANELMAGRSTVIVVAALQFQIGVADSRNKHPDKGESLWPARYRYLAS